VQTLQLPHQDLIHPEFFSVRGEVIQQTYPRLLYLFSHVVCYVFDGAQAQGQHVMEQILSFANSSAHSTSNVVASPHLIIVLNKLQLQSCAKTESEALERFRQSNPDKFQLVHKLFSSVTVLHIPDGSWPDSFSTYVTRLGDLKMLLHKLSEDAISKRVSTRFLHNKGEILDSLDLALNFLAEKRDAAFNLHELQLRTVPPPSNLTEHLISYFQLNLHHYGKHMDASESYDLSRQALISRILDVYLLHYARGGEKAWSALSLGEEESKVYPLFEDLLAKCQQHVDDCCPCSGTTQISTLVLRCTSVKSMHGGMHQSDMATMTGNPCRWDGDFTPAGARTIPTLLQFLEQAVLTVKKPDRRDFLLKHRMLRLKSLAVKVSSLDTCIGCLLQAPTEGHACGHSLCLSCSEENPDSCIICGQQSAWRRFSLPPNCGFRILSLDGGGIRGVVELLILKRLEALLYNISIVKFFDLIGGTSTGGIIALALGARGLTVDEGLEMYRKLGSRAFVPRAGANIPIIGQLIQYLWYRHKYHRENLHRELENARQGNVSNLSNSVFAYCLIVFIGAGNLQVV
jgi:hypothetical protein